MRVTALARRLLRSCSLPQKPACLASAHALSSNSLPKCHAGMLLCLHPSTRALVCKLAAPALQELVEVAVKVEQHCHVHVPRLAPERQALDVPVAHRVGHLSDTSRNKIMVGGMQQTKDPLRNPLPPQTCWSPPSPGQSGHPACPPSRPLLPCALEMHATPRYACLHAIT